MIREALARLFGSESESDGLPTVAIDTAIAAEILKNDRRRLIVQMVAEAAEEGDTMTVSDIAEALTMAEEDCEEHEYSSRERKARYVSTYQVHVPRLCEHGVIAADDADQPSVVAASELTHDVAEWARALENYFVGDGTTGHQQHHDFESIRQEVLSA